MAANESVPLLDYRIIDLANTQGIGDGEDMEQMVDRDEPWLYEPNSPTTGSSVASVAVRSRASRRPVRNSTVRTATRSSWRRSRSPNLFGGGGCGGNRMATCDNCGYEWDYSGELNHTTCPNCNRKTSVTTND